MANLKNLKGTVVIVTGAAQGIGKIIAKAFAEQGASVIIADIDKEKGKDTEKFMQELGLKVIFYNIDLRREEDIKAMIKFTIKKFNHLDILINNARPKLNKTAILENSKEWDLAMEVLLKAPFLTAKYAVDHLIKTKGKIINIASTNAFLISHQPSAYHIAKAGLIQLTKYLAYKFGPMEIKVNAICPALIDLQDKDGPLTKNPVYKSVIESIVPLKRAATGEEIAQIALFLSSDSAKYITGHTLIIDGGMTLGDSFHNTLKHIKKKG